jgi:hypothetical protein
LSKADLRGDKKWQRGNRRLIILEDPPNRCRGVAELGMDQLQFFKRSPESLFAEPFLIAWKAHTAFVRCATIALEIAGRPLRAIAMTLPQPKRARHAWEMGHALIRRRMNARRPLMFAESQSDDEDYLVVEDIPNAVDLNDAFKEKSRSLPQSQWHSWLNEVGAALAVELRKLHEHGFYQPNLRFDTLLMGQEVHTTLWFDSLETMRQVRKVDSWQIASSLAILWLSWPSGIPNSLTNALRFLRVFLGRQFSEEWKNYWQASGTLIQRQLAREAA